jgi:hypothetical protein
MLDPIQGVKTGKMLRAGFKFQQLSTLFRLCNELAGAIGCGKAYSDLEENEHAGWL